VKRARDLKVTPTELLGRMEQLLADQPLNDVE
jgi:hypothetical protein